MPQNKKKTKFYQNGGLKFVLVICSIIRLASHMKGKFSCVNLMYNSWFMSLASQRDELFNFMLRTRKLRNDTPLRRKFVGIPKRLLQIWRFEMAI